jgi:hypothetical protein
LVKEIVVGILAAVGTALTFWFSGVLTKIPASLSIPSGAVVAFNAEACPENGWREYKLAHGRFIRGIDKSGDNIDPLGKRTAGSLQSDTFARHSHKTRLMIHDNNVDGVDSATTRSSEHHNQTKPTETAGGAETRPKNVALLYCEKV